MTTPSLLVCAHVPGSGTGQRGFHGMHKRALREGGWPNWRTTFLTPYGDPPVYIRAPFGGAGGGILDFGCERKCREAGMDWAVDGFVEAFRDYPEPIWLHERAPIDDQYTTVHEMAEEVSLFRELAARRHNLPTYYIMDTSALCQPYEDGYGAQAVQLAYWLKRRSNLRVMCEPTAYRPAHHWRGFGFATRSNPSNRSDILLPSECEHGAILLNLAEDMRRFGLIQWRPAAVRAILNTAMYPYVAVYPGGLPDGVFRELWEENRAAREGVNQ